MKIPIIFVLSINLLLGNLSTLQPKTAKLEVSTHRMVWTDGDGNEIDETENNLVSPMAIFTGTCGTAEITANGKLVKAKVTPFGWKLYSGIVYITYSRFDSRQFNINGITNTYSYELQKRYGQRTLTLTGYANDITGKTCSIVPNATIVHYW